MCRALFMPDQLNQSINQTQGTRKKAPEGEKKKPDTGALAGLVK